MKNIKIIPFLIMVVLALTLLPLTACGEVTTTTAPGTTVTAPGTTVTAPGTTVTTTAVTTATTVVPEAPQYGGTLRIVWSTGPGPGWGTPVAIFGGEAAYGEPAMESLMEAYFMGGYVNRLGTSYDMSDDGLSITFQLRRGVKFHDGTDFNADAVKYNFDKWAAAGRASATYLGCDVINDYSVKFNFAEALNINLPSVATSVMIASPTAWEENGDTYAAFHAVGTGPFKQVSYEEGAKIRLERFDDYWGPKPYLDAIEGIFIPDPVTQVMAMQAGEGDVTHSRDAKTMNNLKEAGLNVLQNFMGMEAMNFNSRDPDSPFHDVRVRQAFEHAINKPAIIDALGYGYWEVAHQFPIQGMTGYLDDIVPRTYDPEKARELLKKKTARHLISTTDINSPHLTLSPKWKF